MQEIGFLNFSKLLYSIRDLTALPKPLYAAVHLHPIGGIAVTKANEFTLSIGTIGDV